MKRLTLPLLAALYSTACRDHDDPDADADDSSDGGSADEGSSTGAVAAITYWQDLAPVIMDRCAGCHTEGGIAPFALDSYDAAAPWAASAAQAVASKAMPPWLVEADGSCGDFHEPRVLDDDEIAMFQAWASEGAKPGDPRDDLKAPEPDRLLDADAFMTPEFVPMVTGGELTAHDEYRCFLIDPQLEQDRFVTAFEVVPGNASIVHHVLMFNVDPSLDLGGGATNLDAIEALDAESPDRDGWPCFGAAGEGVEPAGLPVVWAPGTSATRYPEGVGARVSAGELFVVQVHYNLAGIEGESEPDRSEVRLQLEDAVEREGFMQLPDPFLDSIFGDTPESLPPGLAATDYSWDLPVAAALPPGVSAFEIHGVFPHMHERGQQMRMDRVRDGQSSCEVFVPQWDFHWQGMYFYEQPVVVDAADTLHVTCTYDTRDATEPVLPGWGTQNEMCLMGLFVVPVL
jgi:Copper type II ascorbate-dependent monooxygenase, C-terminal domain